MIFPLNLSVCLLRLKIYLKESILVLLYIKMLNGSDNLAPYIFLKDESLGFFLRKMQTRYLKEINGVYGSRVAFSWVLIPRFKFLFHSCQQLLLSLK